MKETIRTNVSDCETSKTIDFKEHQTCPFYTADQRNGYNHQFLENDEETRIEKKGYNLIVFVLKGVLQLKTGHIIRKGTMYLWSEDENNIEGRAGRILEIEHIIYIIWITVESGRSFGVQ